MRDDFYGITPGEHPPFVEDECRGFARWADLPPQAMFFEGVERFRGLYCELGAETFGRVLRFVAAVEVGIPPPAEAMVDLDAEPEFALG
jgi:hypothetical protein